MRFQKALLGLVAIVSAWGAGCSYSKHTAVPVPVITIEHTINKSKEKVSLQCDEADRITILGSTFYACNNDLNPELIEKLEFVAAVKEYSRTNLGFKQTTNYREYKNNVTEEPETNYRLYIVPKFEVPQKWEECGQHIEVPGEHRVTLDKATYFYSSADDLLDEKEYYDSLGFDTHWRSFTNFGSGCNLTPEFLERSPESQAKTILHEDLHATVDEKDLEQNIEESIASLLGYAGAVDFTAGHFGKDSEEHKSAKKQLKDRFEYSKKIVECNSRLLELYEKKIPDAEKLKEKEGIIKKLGCGENNAELWDRLPYTKNFVLIYQIYQKMPNLKELAKILLKTPKKEKEAIKYLEKIFNLIHLFSINPSFK